MARDVFISYRHEDSDAAHRICAMLEREGISCWIAPRDVPPGQQWPTAITEGIHRSQNLVLVLSSHSRNSKQIAREVEIADRNGLVILTFRLEDTDPPPSLEYFLTNLQWIDGFDGKFESAVYQLAAAVRTNENFPAAKTELWISRPGLAAAASVSAKPSLESAPTLRLEDPNTQPYVPPETLSVPAVVASKFGLRSTQIALAGFVLVTGLGGATYFLSSPLSRTTLPPKAVSSSKYTNGTTAGLSPTMAAKGQVPSVPANASSDTGTDSPTKDRDTNSRRAHSPSLAASVTQEMPLAKQTRPPSPITKSPQSDSLKKTEPITQAAAQPRQEPGQSVQVPQPTPIASAGAPGKPAEEESAPVTPQPASELSPSEGTNQATPEAVVKDWLHRVNAGELNPLMKGYQSKMLASFGTVQPQKFQGCEEDGKGGFNCRYSASSDKFPSLLVTLHVGHGVVTPWQVNGYNASTL